MFRLTALAFVLWSATSIAAAPLSAFQNADQKQWREYILEGASLKSRVVGTEAYETCAGLPAKESFSTLEASGDQHLVLKNADGKPIWYYHTVTDVWCAAEKFVPKKTFSPSAWAVVAGYFCLMVLMGWYFMRQEKSSNDFFKGGQRIPWYVAGVSIYATMLSSITFLSVPALAYISDWRLFPNMIVGMLVVAPIAILFYMPVFRRSGLTSAYEYLEKRFNLGTRLFASGAFVVFMVLRVAVVTLLPAIALDAVTGMGVDLAIAVCGVGTIAYCAFGGLEAVIWSDFVQGLVLIGGAVAILVCLVMGTDGGLSGALSMASAAKKDVFWDFRPEFGELVFWVACVQGITQFAFSFTSDQCIVQRYISVRDEKAATRSIWFNYILSLLGGFVFFGIGTALWTHYKCHPEMLNPALPKPDAILPTFMGTELPPILAGLVIAAVFAATVSTLSANLSAASSALTTDFVVRFRPQTTDRQKVRFGQAFVVLTGVSGTFAAFVMAHIDLRSLCDVFQELISTLTAGITGVFALGIFFKRVNGRAATVALLVNYLVCLVFKYGGVSASLGLHPFLTGGIALVACIVTGTVLGMTPWGMNDLKVESENGQ